MAGIPSEAARSIRASGCDAPSRKLKALAACSSTYCSVIERHHLPPVVDEITHEAAAEHEAVGIAGDEVPLLLSPERGGPPAAVALPRTIGLFNGVAVPAKPEGCRPSMMQCDRDSFR